MEKEKKQELPPVAPASPIFGEQYLLKDGVIHKPCKQCGGWMCRTEWLNNGDHTYKCLRCAGMEGCPTEWALCSMRGIISKDLTFNECWLCEIYVNMKVTYDPQGRRRCPKFVRLLKFEDVYHHPTYMKEKKLRIIEEGMHE